MFHVAENSLSLKYTNYKLKYEYKYSPSDENMILVKSEDCAFIKHI